MNSNIDEQIRTHLTGNLSSEIPELVRSRLEQTLQLLETESMPMQHRTHSRHRKSWFVAAAVVLAIGGTLASGFISPAMAETLRKVPFIGQIFEALGDNALKDANRKGLSLPVNLSATDQGITLTITEVLYDGVEIKLGIQESSMSKLPIILDRSNRYEIVKSRTQEDPAHALDIWSHAWSNVRSETSTQNIGILSFESMLGTEPDRDAKISKEFPLPITIKKVGDVEGNWKFEIPVKWNASLTKKIPINKTNKAPDGIGSITLQSVVTSPLGTEIRFKTAEAYPSTSSSWSGFNSDYMVVDENGYIISSAGGSGGPGNQMQTNIAEMIHTKKYDPIPERSKTLIFKPYKSGRRYGDAAITLNPSALPLTLQQGEVGSVTVNSMAFEEDRVIIQYDVNGNDPVGQKLAMEFIQDGKRVFSDNSKLLRVNNSVYSYVGEYPFQKDMPIKLYSSKLRKATFYKELEFQVPLR
ncbi:DUF4179 domain-containing protein [Paenibacillus sp. NAIST15-1]|uniref:DUF4179 domain-containing protein n=1 Tax=Paenibacillus sp. NAIST15-1 TaxID=1605994 RepID=UPI00086B050C|nr:DUF4179 domain-containing protein [Paenibacillus sp. NAIST15-1]GAV10249.1 hypothetical protein PBN151_0154 [Paenibacillus sp. NAIST15-1]